MGITVHQPGTQPVIDFENLQEAFGFHDSDDQLIRKALGLGRTFW